MKRTFKTADYDATLDVTVRLGDCLPPDHLARFVVDMIAQLDLSAIYARYGARGGQPLRGRQGGTVTLSRTWRAATHSKRSMADHIRHGSLPI